MLSQSDSGSGKHMHRYRIQPHGLYISVATFIFACLAIFFDPGPELPPFSDEFSSIDCDSVSFESMRVENDTLWFTFNAEDSIEFPPAYLPYFLSVGVNSTDKAFMFTREDAHNLTRVGKKINFSVKLPVYGEYRLTFYCLNEPFDAERVRIDTVNQDNSSTSSSPNPEDDFLVLDNVCVIKNRLGYFTNTNGKIKPIKYFNTTYPVDFYPWDAAKCASYHNLTMHNETTFVLDKMELNWWSSILFTLNPIAESIRRFSIAPKYNFVFNKLPPKGSADLLKRFHAKLNTKMEENACFKRLVFTGMNDTSDFSDNGLIRKALRKNFTLLRTTFVQKRREPRKIILPSCVSHLEGDVKEVCPDCEIFSLTPRLDTPTVADQVSKGTILIGNHLMNLVNAVWLEPNETAVIDVSPPDHQVCIDYAKDFVQGLNVSYFGVLNDFYANKTRDTCRCKTFSCMKPMPQIEGVIDRERFKKALSAAINLTMH